MIVSRAMCVGFGVMVMIAGMLAIVLIGVRLFHMLKHHVVRLAADYGFYQNGCRFKGGAARAQIRDPLFDGDAFRK